MSYPRTICVAAVLVTFFAVLAACSGDNKPPVTPTSSATEVVGTTSPPTTIATSGTPIASAPIIQPGPDLGDVRGPVLVYETGRSLESLVAYDLGRQRVVWRLDRPLADPDPILSFAAFDDGVAMNTRLRVYWQPLDGSPAEVLIEAKPDWVDFTTISGSPDKHLLAVSVRRPTTPLGTPTPTGQAFRVTGSVLFYDLTQRREVTEVTGNDEVPLREGWLSWREDGRGVVLNSYTNSERPGPEYGVFLDGSAVAYNVDGFTYLAPNGTRLVHGLNTLGCEAIASHDFYVRDLDRGIDVAEIHNDQVQYTGYDWSPDSREFLFEIRPHLPDARCLPSPPDYAVLNTETGLVQAVADLEALYKRWYGSGVLWVECNDEFLPLATASYGNRTAYCEGADGAAAENTLRYDQLAIDRGLFFRIVGLID